MIDYTLWESNITNRVALCSGGTYPTIVYMKGPPPNPPQAPLYHFGVEIRRTCGGGWLEIYAELEVPTIGPHILHHSQLPHQLTSCGSYRKMNMLKFDDWS